MNYDLMNYEDALEMSELEKDPAYQAKQFEKWFKAFKITPNPWNDPEYFEIPAYIRGIK